MQTTLEGWGFALPAGRQGQRNQTRSTTNNTDNIGNSSNTSTSVNTSNKKVPARKYYNKNTPLPYSIESYIGWGNSTTNNHHFISNSKKWKSKLYGDPMKDKGEGVCRIVSQNKNCIGIDAVSNPKIHTAKEWLYHHEVDICG